MPKTKDPFARYQQINDTMLMHTSGRSVVKAEALAEKLDISLRQLRTDMDTMRDMGVPFEYDPVLKGWRYPPGTYFTLLDKLALSGEDLACLRIAVETLAKVNQIKDFKKLPEIFGKIHRAAKKWVHKGEAVGKSVYFDPLPHYDGGTHLPFFLKAIDEMRRVSFLYQAFHAQEPKTVVFDPWFLRHYDRRWYVGGFSHDPAEQFVRVFPLERIKEQPQNIGFCRDKPRDYDAESYWHHIYGITIPPARKMEVVELRFWYPQQYYFLSAPFFEPFEVLSQSRESAHIRLHLIPNIDLVQKLASYGSGVTVLAPHSLRTQMAFYLEKALSHYRPS